MSKRLTAWILCIWLVLMLLFIVVAYVTRTYSDSPYQDVMLKASARAQKAFDEIKQYKINNNIQIDTEYDLLETGMIGKENSYITTTEGVLKSKRTSVNPHWAAVIVSMFAKANLRAGDQVLMVFSGSFPALNICAIAAGQEYGLDMCLMASVGASNFGATDEEFTFFDMVAYLCGYLDQQPQEQVFDKQSMLDYVSLGGGNDCGRTFGSYMIWDDNATAVGQDYANEIANRIKAFEQKGVVTFISQSNFENNISTRLAYANNDVPNAKFVLNVGGSMVGLGIGLSAHLESGYRAQALLSTMVRWSKSTKTTACCNAICKWVYLLQAC